ncbi:hypothetical protein BDW62DRAFT_199713 [Aspergillus aurantiobrunneus]
MSQAIQTTDFPRELVNETLRSMTQLRRSRISEPPHDLLHPRQTTISDLPQELVDQITIYLIGGEQVDEHARALLKNIRQINKSFYWSASRLLYRSVHLHLQCYWPLICPAFEGLSLSGSRQYVHNLCIHDTKNPVPCEDALIQTRSQQFPRVMSRFPALRRVYIEFDWARSSCLELDKAQASAFWESLPAKLQVLTLDRAGSVFCPDQDHERHFHRVMPSLRWFSSNSCHHKREFGDSAVFLALKHAQSLERLSLSGLGWIPYSSLQMIPRGIRLRRLELRNCRLLVSEILSLEKFKDVLEEFCLSNVSLQCKGKTWEDVFDMLNSFTVLTRLVVERYKYPQIYYGCYLPSFEREQDNIAYKECLVHVDENRARLGRQGQAEDDKDYPTFDHKDTYQDFKVDNKLRKALKIKHGDSGMFWPFCARNRVGT